MSIFEYAPAPESRAVVDIKESYGLFVNGEFTSGAGTAFKTVNPATEEVLAEVAEADASDVDRAVKAAREALSGPWSRMKPAERQAIMLRLADLAQDAGLDGIVCSGHEVGEVHRRWKHGFFVVPGLRPAGSAVGDQKRVVTPRAARDDGASVLVIGRPIAKADDPLAAAKAIEGTL